MAKDDGIALLFQAVDFGDQIKAGEIFAGLCSHADLHGR